MTRSDSDSTSKQPASRRQHVIAIVTEQAEQLRTEHHLVHKRGLGAKETARSGEESHESAHAQVSEGFQPGDEAEKLEILSDQEEKQRQENQHFWVSHS